ncbi:MAG: PQQ-binding-like beta-propeller repeat protein, partial [Verrucomicrobiales bacterium]|nr:PQQ-binding-like beta-propeller repeat protein [Verrucomicrobiales bacterium]
MRIIFYTLIICGLGSSMSLRAEDWPQYLGPTRDTVWNESGVRLDFEECPPKLLWSQPIGSGYSGPSVSANRVFVMDRKSEPYVPEKIKPGTNPNFIRAKIKGKERVICLSTESGKMVWSHEYDSTYTSVFIYAIGPRTTPLVHDGHVFTLGAEGQLNAYQSENGKLLWSKNLITNYGIE